MITLKNLHIRFLTPLFISLIILLSSGRSAYGQDDCAAILQEARRYYDLGMIDDIPQMLAACMEEGFTRAQKVEAYKLIILAYLFDDNQFEAEKTMVEFLRKFPEYEIMPNDPVEFIYLFESYGTTSVWSVGLTAGFNLTNPRIIEPYSAFDLNGTTLLNKMKPGFQLGLGVARYVNKNILLNLELYISSNKYKFIDELQIPLYDGPDGINRSTYTEKTLKVELPVTAAYELTIKKIHYFVRAGVSVARFTSVTGQPELKYSEELPQKTGENYDMALYRKKMLYSGILGIGMRYKVPRGVIMLDLRTNLGLNKIVRSEKRYDNQTLSDEFFYLDDDFSLNTFSFSASYYFSFYKPKKQR